MQLEQQPEFVILRRILRAVAPHYVLNTSSELKPGESEIRTDTESVIVSETTPTEDALPIVLFQIGHIHATELLPADPAFLVSADSADAQGELVTGMARIFAKRDRHAREWALFALQLFWPEASVPHARTLLDSMVKSPFQWLARIDR